MQIQLAEGERGAEIQWVCLVRCRCSEWRRGYRLKLAWFVLLPVLEEGPSENQGKHSR
jgi:hypothetical protein